MSANQAEKFITRLDEHGPEVDHPTYQQKKNCSEFANWLMLLSFPEASLSNTFMNEIIPNNCVKIFIYILKWTFSWIFYIRKSKESWKKL